MAQQMSHPGGAEKARSLVNRAVRLGDLPHATTLECVDCGAQASEYDHRDYNAPLDVDPVCSSCNKHRGAGIPALGHADQIRGSGAGFVLSANGICRVKFRYLDFGLYEDADVSQPVQCRIPGVNPASLILEGA